MWKSTVSDPYFYYINRRRISRNFEKFEKYPQFRFFLLQNARKSRSQYFQDLFVQFMYVSHFVSDSNFEENGHYFVEFGATDGINISNTFFLENHHRWKGLLAEPARMWHSHLKRNRKCDLDFRCVFSSSGMKLDFFESFIGSLSTLKQFSQADFSGTRGFKSKYLVETTSLDDLLIDHHSPQYISYLSLDTEGSEYEILRNFPFHKWNIGVITVEHNFSPNRILLQELLLRNGFEQVFSEISECDDWFVNSMFFQISHE